MAEDGAERAVLRAIEELAPGKPAIACVLRPRPLEPVAGKRVAFFTTARPDAHGRLERHLREEHGIDVVAVSGSLTRREELERDLERIDAEVYLVEIKAAAIDVVAERAAERGVEVVFADSDVLPLPGQPDLDAAIEQLAETAAREAVPG
jgi:cyclic 2,3-diphosphoglycerate synthetase